MSETNWMNDERVKNIEKSKLDFLQKLVFEMETVTPKERLPFLLALANRAKQENISFEEEEINNIVSVLKENSNADELDKMDKILKMFHRK